MKKRTFPRATIIIIIAFLAFIIGQKIYFMPNYDDGELAPDFTAELLTSGQSFKLSDLKGNYVLLDFWGSWCGPCIRENQNLVKLNEKYADKKFQDAASFKIVSVGIEKDVSRQRKAISKQGLKWQHHITDLVTSYKFFDSQIASKYGVKEVPTSFFIDEKGQIVGVNMKMEEIDAFLTAQQL